MRLRSASYFIVVFLLLAAACKPKPNAIFKKVDAGKTNIDFVNVNKEGKNLNILDYLYFYNGAGVATGDFNNDSLEDIYFVSNQQSNKLYLNKGGLKFEDITAKAGVQGKGNWKTGATVVDINNDGYLDIYLSVVSQYKGFKGQNQLFINNGNLTFTEKAAEYGVAFSGLSTQASFLDYDKDGDLDLFILTHSVHSNDTYGDSTLRFKYNEIGGDHLYRNDGGKFTDVTKGSGIYAAPIGYGLGISVSDLNNDGWDDLYISNDFFEQDYYYINQKNGTFKEQLKNAFGHTSLFSMGNAVADMNCDGQLDVLSTDMLPEDMKALKSTINDEALDIYNMEVKAGYYYQYSRNALQLNVANGEKFVDIGLYAGISATDWTWSPLVHDFDMDGRKDIFFSNGIKKRLNDLDYLKYLGANTNVQEFNKTRVFDQEKIDHMPDGRVHNVLYRGDSLMRFTDISADNEMTENSASAGSVAVDLDNDGDLDLITNNMDEPAFIYQNTTMEKAGENMPSYLTFLAKYQPQNRNGIGTKLYVKTASGVDHQEIQTSTAFQSSQGTNPFFTFKKGMKPQEMLVVWPDNSWQIVKNFSLNKKQMLTWRQNQVSKGDTISGMIAAFIKSPATITSKPVKAKILVRVKVSETPDFNYYSLTPHSYLPHTPAMASADINGDGYDDLYVGGMEGEEKYLMMGSASGFKKQSVAAFKYALNDSDAQAEWADMNGDDRPDLIVQPLNHPFADKDLKLPRMYLNQGGGNFTGKPIPADIPINAKLFLFDADGDGRKDLLFCGGVSFREFGKSTGPLLMLNTGDATFIQARPDYYAEIGKMPFIKDVAVADVDGNGKEDLIVAAEWQELTLFLNDDKALKRSAILPGKKGWWQSVTLEDVDGDGKPDLLAGNWGLNNKFNVTAKTPLYAYSQDLDNEGKNDFILSYPYKGKYYLFRPKNDLEQELPYMKKEWLSYQKMADKTTEEIFKDKLDNKSRLEANMFESVLISDIKGKKVVKILPWLYQQSPVISAVKTNDKQNPLLLNGNFWGVVPYEGKYDALGLVALSWNTSAKNLNNPVYWTNAQFNFEDLTWLRQVKRGGKTGYVAMTYDGRLFLFE